MTTDAELLQRYAGERSEAAFAELVTRHLPLVYSAALRQLGGDAHLARDVAQEVFVALARKASALAERTTIAGWLYLGTHHAAAQAVRARQRRETREQEAHVMHELLAPTTPAADWDRVRPLLDAAMRELSESDREAVLLRYFEQRPFAEVGAALNLGEDAARMRVERALDKLHALLGKRGITSTSAALGVALAHQAAVAAPPALAGTIVTTALASAGSGGVVAAATGIGFMSGINLAPAVTVLAALVAVGAAIYNVRENQVAERTLLAATEQSAAAAARRDALERRAVEVERTLASPAKAPPMAAAPMSSTAGIEDDPQEKAFRAGDAFLAAHPEARRLIDEMVLGIFDRNYLTAMRAVGLSEAEADRIAAEASKATSIHIRAGTSSDIQFRLGSPGPNAEMSMQSRLRELLGDERYREVEERRLALAARGLIKTLATATFDSDVPLTPAQAETLAGIIERNRNADRSDPTKVVYALDWKTIRREAATVLSPPQLAVLNVAVERDAPATQTLKLGR